jgi:ribosomal protein S18 acetylase RimI-like enzyme
LELRANNHVARAFYTDIGFAEAAQVPGYYRGVETAVRMVRVLRTHNELPPFPDLS